MSEMVERVARAICLALGVDPDQHFPCYSEGTTPKRAWKDYAASARAAIEAMREPTKEMVVAVYGELQSLDPDYYTTGDAFRSAWPAVIDAALGTNDEAPDDQG